NTEMNATLTNATLINKLEKRVPELEEQIEMLRQKTASSAEIIPLISTMEEEAQRLDLKFLNMVTNVQEPLSPDQRKVQAQDTPAWETSEYTKIVITINLQGRYKKIEEFIRTLQIIAPFLVIDEVSIRAEEDIYPELQARLVIKAYSREGENPDVIAGEF
ncbi:MAG: GspMb/PilO family protein, partial [Candidatus Brocadiales bacterium]